MTANLPALKPSALKELEQCLQDLGVAADPVSVATALLTIAKEKSDVNDWMETLALEILGLRAKERGPDWLDRPAARYRR